MLFFVFALFALIASACDIDLVAYNSCVASVGSCLLSSGTDDENWCDCYDDGDCDGWDPDDDFCGMSLEELDNYIAACNNAFTACFNAAGNDADALEECVCDAIQCYTGSASSISAFIGVVAVALFAALH
jgi:hypothetical protein